MDLQEIDPGIAKHIAQKLKHPFYAAFAIAFIIINWRPILYVVYPMDWDLSARLVEIDRIYYSTWYWTLLRQLVAPFLVAASATLLFPRILNAHDRRVRLVEIDQENRLMEIEEKRAEVVLSLARKDKIINAKSEEIEGLEYRLKATNQTNSDLSKEIALLRANIYTSHNPTVTAQMLVEQIFKKNLLLGQELAHVDAGADSDPRLREILLQMGLLYGSDGAPLSGLGEHVLQHLSNLGLVKTASK